MAQKLRACNIVGALRLTEKMRARKKLNFDNPEEDEETGHEVISASTVPDLSIDDGQNLIENSLFITNEPNRFENILSETDNTEVIPKDVETAPESPVITELLNIDASRYDSNINDLFNQYRDQITDIPDKEVITENTSTLAVPPTDILSSDYIITEPLPSTSGVSMHNNTRNMKSNHKRKAKVNKQYLDYISDEDDFTAIFGDSIDSDSYDPPSSSSDSEDETLKSQNNTEEPIHQTEINVVGENAKKKKRKNVKKERQHLKRTGQAYTKHDGTEIPAKKIKPNPCIGKICGNNCETITNEKRQDVFNYFWNLSIIRRKDWLISMTQKTAVKRKRHQNSEKRTFTYKYSLNEGEGKRPVCLQFLAATLDISVKFIQYTIQNAEIGLSKEDGRGKCEPHNKTKESTAMLVVNFIKRLPAVPSHYCRKDSSRVYLPSEYKNLSNLYQHYKRVYIREGINIVSERVFRSIFKDFNIGFHVPKKDKCIKCLRYEQNKDNAALEDEKREHEKEKEESYKRFKAHQNIHKNDPSTLCASFDLQKVLNTPYGDSMLLFYSRKLAVYNLCVYENGTRKVYTFYWDESNGKRGSNEIATILNKYIKIVDDRGDVKNLLLYCDCCPGQNRNKTILAMLHMTLQSCKNIETIQINFLLTGHTYMPVDSVHAVIERNLKKNIIHAPSQWYTVFTTARKEPEPYLVEHLTYKDFFKWDAISEKYFKGNLVGKISKLRVVTFKKSHENEVLVKYSMNEHAKSSRLEVLPKAKLTATACYKSQLPISKMKQDDLLKLCRDMVIPQIFHDEYNRLTSANNVKDCLPESDVEDTPDN